MHVTGFEITQAWLADLAFGDPQWMPHPCGLLTIIVFTYA